VSRHDTVDELKDTIRHEAIHVAQFCRGGENVFKDAYVAKHASPAIREHISTEYEKDVQAIELEAFVVAGHATQEEIAFLVTEMCTKDPES
jgi:hypothetical protein